MPLYNVGHVVVVFIGYVQGNEARGTRCIEPVLTATNETSGSFCALPNGGYFYRTETPSCSLTPVCQLVTTHAQWYLSTSVLSPATPSSLYSGWSLASLRQKMYRLIHHGNHVLHWYLANVDTGTAKT